MAKKDTLVPMTIRLPETYHKRIDDLADKMGLDRAEATRRVVRNGIEDLEKAVKIASHPAGEMIVRLANLFEASSEERAEVVEILRSIGESKDKKRASKTKPTST